MKIKILLLLLLCCTARYGRAQKELKEGEKMPDLAVSHVWNSKYEQIQIGDLNKKLVIFDFWGFGCSSCIESFPKLDSLQKKYDSLIQIILVNKESLVATKKFFEAHKKIKRPTISFITEDTILHVLFPHIYVPHIVMLDSNKTVRHITGGENLTDKNIASLLANQKVDLRSKFELKDYDKTKPPIAEGNGRWLKNIKYYSYLMTYTPELTVLSGGTIISDTLNGSIEMQCNNRTIGDLFAWIATKGKNRNKFLHKNTIAFEVKDTTKFVRPLDSNLWDSWYAQNCFFYNLKIPMSDSAHLFKMMEEDITKYFPYQAAVEQRTIPTLVLSLGTDSLDLKTTGGERLQNITTDMNGNYSIKLKNYPPTDLKYMIGNLFNSASCPYPFISTISTSFNIDLNISFDKGDLTSIQLALHRVGLELTIKDVVGDVLVIKDK